VLTSYRAFGTRLSATQIPVRMLERSSVLVGVMVGGVSSMGDDTTSQGTGSNNVMNRLHFGMTPAFIPWPVLKLRDLT